MPHMLVQENLRNSLINRVLVLRANLLFILVKVNPVFSTFHILTAAAWLKRL